MGESKMKKVHKALDVALYITNYCADNGTPISNLKLQKILYYLQAAFIVERGYRCFNESIVHWDYGPVVEEVYYEFRDYGYNGIPKDANYTDIVFNKKKNEVEINEIGVKQCEFSNSEIFLINKVVESYINMEPFMLVEKSHREDPWKNTKRNEEITEEEIKDYYSKNKKKIYGEAIGK